MMDEEKLAKEVNRRVARAELDRSRHQGRMWDCYRYALPWRHGFEKEQDPTLADEIFDSTALTAVADFGGDMLATFTPPYADWVDARPAQRMDTGQVRQIAAALRAYQEVVFAEMRRSNVYEALQEAYPDLAVGTMALYVQDRHPTEPIHCQAVPITDLLLDRGPFGEVDGRWRRWKVRGEDVLTLWPDARPSSKTPRLPDAADQAEYQVTDGVYRDWSRRDTAVYRYVVMLGSGIIVDRTYVGEGSCPLIVARWATDSQSAWGIGPLYRVLADVKTVNYVKERGLKNLDKAVDPVTAYDDDGVINVENGISAGMWIPKAPGSDISVVESAARFDVAWLEIEDLRAAIKRALFQDGPDQPGKTPPTATQWLDEAMKTARRMGAPSGKLVSELQYPLFMRFAYLLARRGVLPEVKLNGEDISLVPVSPLLRAQRQEELMRMDRLVEMVGMRLGPEMANLLINQQEYVVRAADILGVPPQLIRSEAGVKEITELVAQMLAAAQQQGAPAA